MSRQVPYGLIKLVSGRLSRRIIKTRPRFLVSPGNRCIRRARSASAWAPARMRCTLRDRLIKWRPPTFRRPSAYRPTHRCGAVPQAASWRIQGLGPGYRCPPCKVQKSRSVQHMTGRHHYAAATVQQSHARLCPRLPSRQLLLLPSGALSMPETPCPRLFVSQLVLDVWG